MATAAIVSRWQGCKIKKIIKIKHSCGTILSLFKLPEGVQGAGIKVHRWVGRRPSQRDTRLWEMAGTASAARLASQVSGPVGG